MRFFCWSFSVDAVDERVASIASFLHALVFSPVAFASRSCLGLAVSEIEAVAEVVAVVVLGSSSDESCGHGLVKFSFLGLSFSLAFVLAFALLTFSFSFSFALAVLSFALAPAFCSPYLSASLPQVCASSDSFLQVDYLSFLIFDSLCAFGFGVLVRVWLG